MTEKDEKTKPVKRQVPEPPEARRQGKEDSVITIQPRHRPGDCQASDIKAVSSDYPGDILVP